MSQNHPWVILFDIDGTLLTVNEHFNRPLLREILDELEIDYPDMETDPFSGRTDHDIFTSFLVNHDYDQELYQTMKSAYLNRLKNRLSSNDVTRHDHIDWALDYFSQPEFIPALLTGNYPNAAGTKLKAAKIFHNFSFGAFGEHHSDRNQLPHIALDKVRKHLGVDPDPARFIVIGDTPRDVICAKKANMKCVAVTTGKFGKEELSEHNPDLILDDLSEPENWFARISL
ncbi:HAD family hydrolase [Balneola sp. MJW-20]|uniref:HAD family hydrolase n=1 Tax=Gracilimonas aurantiaca TaxID=3234185 RepID=UPI0034650E77